MPAAGLGNVVIALIARFWLHDSISLERWAGILLITVGVGFVAQGPSLTIKPEAEAPALATAAESALGKEQAR
jgi:drug/metabolite transporter (DMT)-like permease